MKFVSALFLAALALWNAACAAGGEPLDLQTRYGHYYRTIRINDDGAAVTTYEWSRTVLKETAVERSKRASIGYSTSAEKAEVLAAYTQKPDGRRIEVPKDNYQLEINKGRGSDSPVYHDRTTLTVVFPDVSVGDTVVLSYKITQTEPLFPKHFAVSETFSADVAHDDVRVRIDYPEALWVQYEARGMKETANESRGGRRIIEWRYANPAPQKNARSNFSVWDPDKESGYAFSTFRTYADMAAAYGERAQPKAAVTERIAKLAAEIVKDKQAPKEQARALYEWVATNITYAGNGIGVGVVVPRDLGFVLDNKMGDCKDHATLLQALLAARGIRSTQALVNSGSVYRLPKIPVVSAVDHVINYLPDFDLFLDSTSDSTPFGLLPFGDQDKPILLVEGFREGAKTPVAPIGSNRQRVETRIKIAADGAVSGTVDVFLNGEGAAHIRDWARKMTKDKESDMVKNVLRGEELNGTGVLQKDDPTALADSYHYKVTFIAEKFIRLPGAGAFQPEPTLGFARPIASMLASAKYYAEHDYDVTCIGAFFTENYVIEFPKGVKVISVPDKMKIANDLLSYAATYTLKGNVLTIRRTMDDRMKSNVCSPQITVEYNKVAEKALDNARAQVLYK